LTPPPPPTSRPPTYEVQNYQTPNGVPNGVISPENYYAATDIIKVSYDFLRSEVQNTVKKTFSSLICQF